MASVVLFLILSIIVGLTVGDYGMTWDEHFRFGGGDSKLAYYKELFSGENPSPQKDNYPGLFDLPLAIAHDLFPEWGTRSQKGHIWSLCFGLLGLLAVWRATARLGGERAGFWALLLLVSVPRYYGHMFFNPKDIPLAATYMLGVWALIALFQKMPKVPCVNIIWVGLTGGLSMSTRIAGFLILVYFGLFVGVYLVAKYAPLLGGNSAKARIKELVRELISWGLRGAFAGCVALIPLVIFWPALHYSPISRAEATVGSVQNYGWGGWVLMQGQFFDATNLPFYYVPYWLLRTIPEVHMFLLLVAFCTGILVLRYWLRSGREIAHTYWLPVSVLAFSGLFPLSYLYVKQPVLYDGMRHFLFALCPLISVAALGFEYWLRRLRPRIVMAIQVFLASAVAMIVSQMFFLHPYQYLYFNTISGGLSGAYMRDDTDYWGVSHKEAAEWLNDYAQEMDPSGQLTFRVHQRYSRWMLKEHLDPDRFEMRKEREGADFYVSFTRFNLHTSYPDARLLHVVERNGVPLCFVFKLPEAL